MQEHHSLEAQRAGRCLAASVAAFVLMLSPAAFAQSWNAPGWYAGIGAGQSSMADEEEVLIGTNLDDSDTGWKVFGGMQFHPNAAVELAYIDLGEFTGSGGGASDNWEATAFNLSAIGSWPVAQQFSIFGKLGLARWDVDDEFAFGGLSASPSETGTDLSYGVGAQYDFADNIGARLEWERFQDVGEEATTGQSDLDLLSASVVFGF